MRPRFVLALLSVAALILGAAFLLRQHLGMMAAAPPPAVESATPVPMAMVTPPPAPAPAAPVAAPALTDEQRQALVDAETDRLQEWSANDDPQSLSNILADLTNPEKEIREAAIEAAKQFGSTNAIPALKAAAANSADGEEQIALLDAAEFLSLPTIADSKVQQPKTPEQIQAAEQMQEQRERHNSR